MRVFAVQHVDVCMFSNGKFKNVVADINENRQVKSSEIFTHTYEIVPAKGPTKNWIAVESTFTNNMSIDSSSDSTNNYKIASSAHRGPQTGDERNVFAIYVSYYVKVKLTLSGMGGEVSLKLPFILGHVDDNDTTTTGIDDSNDSFDRLKDRIGNGKSAKFQNLSTSSGTTTTTACITSTTSGSTTMSGNLIATHHPNKDNIIEEELHEEADAISLCNDDHDDERRSKRQQLKEEKFKEERNLLQRYKLKRESYSRSCEDMESLSKSDGCTVSAVKALVHRPASDSND